MKRGEDDADYPITRADLGITIQKYVAATFQCQSGQGRTLSFPIAPEIEIQRNPIFSSVWKNE